MHNFRKVIIVPFNKFLLGVIDAIYETLYLPYRVFKIKGVAFKPLYNPSTIFAGHSSLRLEINISLIVKYNRIACKLFRRRFRSMLRIPFRISMS